MHEGDCHTAFTDGCCHAFHRSGADVADSEDPRGARFESERLAIGRPRSRLHRVGSRQDESVLVARNLRGEPVSRRFGADEDEEHPRIPSRCRAGPSIDDLDRLELFVSVRRDNLGSGFHPDVRLRCDLLNEVGRHARCQRLAPHEERHRTGVVGEEDGGLPGRVAGPDQIHIVSLRQTGVAACRTVVDAGADESIDRIDFEAPPFHAHRENDRPRSENVASIQRDGHVDRVDGFDAAGHDDLSAQPLRLLERPARELVPGDAVWEPRVVLDPGRGAGLPARGEGLDQPRLQALGGAVDRRRQTRRAAAPITTS
jgi:hypothetical protein